MPTRTPQRLVDLSRNETPSELFIPSGFAPSSSPLLVASAPRRGGVIKGRFVPINPTPNMVLEAIRDLPRRNDEDHARVVQAVTAFLLDMDAALVSDIGVAAAAMLRNEAGRYTFRIMAGSRQAELLVEPLPSGVSPTTLCLVLRRVQDQTGFDFTNWARLLEAVDRDPEMIRRGIAAGISDTDADWGSWLVTEEAAMLVSLRGFAGF